jgi:phage baseplate assembly protein W
MATVIRQTSDFTDLDFSFSKLSTTQDLGKRKGVEAVKQSMKSLIQTKYFERPFQPYLGTNIADLLFENDTMMTRRLIEKSIFEVISNHERRAKLTSVDVISTPDTNEYRVRVYFYVVNNTEQEVFETYLTRTR